MPPRLHSMLDLDAITAAPLREQPYPWMRVDKALRTDSARAALNDFPALGDGGSFDLADVDAGPAIRRLATSFDSPEVRRAMSDKFGLDLSDKPVLVTARGWSRGKDGRIHTDSRTKLLTILMYFNDGWPSAEGRLRILKGPDNLDDYVDEISCDLGQMVAFRVTPDCWHGFRPYEGRRQLLQINYLASAAQLGRHTWRHRLSALFKRRR